MTNDAERYTDVKLKLACRRCGSAGLISLDHLGRMLVCRGCSTWYRLESARLVEVEPPQTSKIHVSVRTNSSAWREHDAVVPNASGPRRRVDWRALGEKLLEFPLRAGAAALMGLLVLCASAYMLINREPAEAKAVELPDELDQRAPLLVQAWLKNDVSLMLRLTESTQDRSLRRWLAKNPPPIQEQSAGAATTKVEIVSVARPNSATADVTLRVSFLAPAGAGSKLVLIQHWVDRKHGWSYVPAVPQAARR